MPSISLSAVPVTQESTLEAPRITTKKWRVLSVRKACSLTEHIDYRGIECHY